MPDINLTKALGLTLDGSLAEGAKLTTILPRFIHLKDTPLDQVPFADVELGLNLTEPIDLSAGSVSLKLTAAGGLALIGPKQRALNEADPFNAITVKDDEVYLAFGLELTAGPEFFIGAGKFTFGFRGERDFSIKCYRRFQKGPAGFPHFGEALGTALASFLLPLNGADLDQLAEDTVLVLAGTGSLTFSGAFSISCPTESLASVSLPDGMSLNVAAGGSVETSAKLTVSGSYQIRLRHLAPRQVELGVYRADSRKESLVVTAEAGVTAGIGSFDLAEKFIGALSRQPVIDVAEFQRALPGEDDAAKAKRIEGFQAALQSAISTRLQVSVAASLSGLQSDEAAWLFAIDLDTALSAPSLPLLTAALEGDFGGLSDAGRLPAGVRQISNVLTRTEVREQSLKTNLLGIANILSIGKVAQVSKLEFNGAGELTLITDTSSANRLRALLTNLGGDGSRLRKMLSENFLIQAAYHVTGTNVLPPEFQSRHAYLEICEDTGRQEMKDRLDVARVLGLVSRNEEQERLAGSRFGRTTLYVETRYGSEVLRRVFVDDSGVPRAIDQFEEFGRSALGALLMDDEGQELRRRYADLGLAGTALWQRMKETGNVAKFGPLFGRDADSDDPQVNAAGSDYLAITGWAEAMNRAGAAIESVEALLAGGSVAGRDDRLARARATLKERLAEVVEKTHEHFGDPLGLVMFYVAAGQLAGRTVLLTGDAIPRLERSTPAPVAAGAGG